MIPLFDFDTERRTVHSLRLFCSVRILLKLSLPFALCSNFFPVAAIPVFTIYGIFILSRKAVFGYWLFFLSFAPFIFWPFLAPARSLSSPFPPLFSFVVLAFCNSSQTVVYT